MSGSGGSSVQRWTPLSVAAAAASGGIIVALAFAPLAMSANAVDRMTTLFIYVILAVMWNALAGYGGLVSVGQQAFIGLGAYAAIRLSDFGVNVYASLALAALAVGAAAWPISLFMLRLRAGEFAIGMWVLAELIHLLVNLDGLVKGETGTSLIALNAFSAEARRNANFWCSLAAMVLLVAAVFVLLRSRAGLSIQALRDDEDAAASLGVDVVARKRLIFVLAAAGCALAGSLWLATSITFQPRTYFGVHWTAYMIFMALVGGLGTFEGPFLGAIIFFLIESWFGETGVWYMIGLGLTALLFALFVPQGLWGLLEGRFGIRLLPVGYRLRVRYGEPAAHEKEA